MKKENIIQSIKVVTLGLMVAVGLSYAFAWTAPSLPPPDGNVPAPVNVGVDNQIKEGILWATGGLGSSGVSYFEKGVVVGDNPLVTDAGAIKFNGTDFLGYTGTEWKSLSAIGGGGGYAPGSKTYTTPGTYTFTVPNDVYTISAEVWGAGGGGGFGPFSMNYKGIHLSTAGGSGGGGGYAKENSYPVTPGEEITIFVGAGGSAGTETGLYFGHQKVTTGGKGGGSSVTNGSSILLTSASGGAGGVSHDYNCGGGSCNGMMLCSYEVKANEGIGEYGVVKSSGEKGSGCLDWDGGSVYSKILPGGKSGKSTNYLGQPVPNAGVGGIGTHNRNTPNKSGNPGQVILWW